jgi:GT2 family glycosyltransferase
MVSIIIINYYQKELLQSCLQSIYHNFTSFPFEIIVINNSLGQVLEPLQKEFPHIKLIENENNGYSQANNLGARHSTGDFLLFLNADTIIQNDFLEDLVLYFAGKEFGAAGLKLYNPNGTFQLSFWKENTFKNEIENKKLEEAFKNKDIKVTSEIEQNHKEVTEVEWVSGAALFIRKNVFDSAGGFDEDFFLFYEDADLCKRLKDKGYKIYFYPYTKIIHLKGVNVNQSFESKTYYFSKLSQLLYYKKHNPLVGRILLRLYLFGKFGLLTLKSFKRINVRIFLLTLGIQTNE